MKRIACILLPLFVLAGCQVTTTPSGDSSQDLSDSEGTAKSKKKKSSSSTTETSDETAPAPASNATPDTTPAEPPAAPAGPDVIYVGTMPETELVGFGGVTADGTEFCAAQNWKDVTIQVVANDKGQTKSLTFKATNVEEANPACAGVTAQPENEHTYTFTNEAPKDAPAKLVPSPGNKPQAELVADVAVHADAGGRVTIHFHRTDAAAPLDWQYTQQFQLTKQ